MHALGSIREIYGIRNTRFSEADKTIRVEYDATRLTAATVRQLLRRTGLDVVEEISLIPPIEPVPPAEPALAAAKT